MCRSAVFTGILMMLKPVSNEFLPIHLFERNWEEKHKSFSSANSINFGRLLPQVVYYFSAYADLQQAGSIRQGDPINVVVPTGNFGNIWLPIMPKGWGCLFRD